MAMADHMAEDGFGDVGYEYISIDVSKSDLVFSNRPVIKKLIFKTKFTPCIHNTISQLSI